MIEDSIDILQRPYNTDRLVLTKHGVKNPTNGMHYKLEQDMIQFNQKEDIDGNNKKYLTLYDRIARLYNVSNKVYFKFKFGGEKNYRNEFLSELEIEPNDKVIEISVGTADNFRFLPKNIKLYGLDISLGMLKQAKRHLKKWKLQAKLFQGTAEFLPFKDESFDVVYHVGGINYFIVTHNAIHELILMATRV